MVLTWNVAESDEFRNIKCFGCFNCCCVMANMGGGGPGSASENDNG